MHNFGLKSIYICVCLFESSRQNSLHSFVHLFIIETTDLCVHRAVQLIEGQTHISLCPLKKKYEAIFNKGEANIQTRQKVKHWNIKQVENKMHKGL